MPDQPNIVVVLSDQQRPDSCGVFGQRLDVTPHLDALAADGVAYENSFTVQPLCGPSRSVIQTGLMPTTTGCWRNGKSLPRDIDTLASRLGDLGYWTGYVGKWHLASDGGYLPNPFAKAERYGTRPIPAERRGGYNDFWIAADALEATSGPIGGHMFDSDGHRVELDGFRVDAVTDIALDAISKATASGRPFLLFVSFLEPHHQNNRFRTIGPKGWAKKFSDFDVPADLQTWRGDWRWNYAEYLACCASIDSNVGRISAALGAANKLDDTVFVYTSDHGSHFRTRNLEYKRTAHDASIRVPLIVNGPQFRGGVQNKALVTNLDLVPTLVKAAGGSVIDSHGRPLQDAVSGTHIRDQFLVQLSESQVGRALRTNTHTYAVKSTSRHPLAPYRHSNATHYREDLVFDLTTDPAQQHNLAGTPGTKSIRQQLAADLADEIERLEGARPEIETT